MRSHSKRSTAFRPALNDIRLEDRVVLNGGVGTAHVATLAAAISPAVRAQQSGSQNTFTRRELLSVYRQQFNAARNSLRQALSTQITQLYANGRPTAEQLANFRTHASGAINATAFGVSSQLALLPRATDRLVAQLQRRTPRQQSRESGQPDQQPSSIPPASISRPGGSMPPSTVRSAPSRTRPEGNSPTT